MLLEGRPVVATVQGVLASGGGPGLKAKEGGETVVTEETRQDQPSALGAEEHIARGRSTLLQRTSHCSSLDGQSRGKEEFGRARPMWLSG